MMLITGATGTIGSRVLSMLTDPEVLDGREVTVRAMTRDPSRLPASPGVEIAVADYDDPVSLDHAVAGVDTLFLVTAAPSPATHHDEAMLAAAGRAGVTRVVRLSAIASGEQAPDGGTIGEWHARADAALRASGMAWTLLRPTTFASNSLWWADAVRSGQPVANLTGDGRQAVIDPDDVAAVAVEALLSPGHASRIHTLTGPELLSTGDQVAILAEALGRTVPVTDLSPEETRQQMLSSGTDVDSAGAALTGLAFVRAGHNAVVTQTVPELLRRPATPFATWVSRNLSAFT